MRVPCPPPPPWRPPPLHTHTRTASSSNTAPPSTHHPQHKTQRSALTRKHRPANPPRLLLRHPAGHAVGKTEEGYHRLMSPAFFRTQTLGCQNPPPPSLLPTGVLYWGVVPTPCDPHPLNENRFHGPMVILPLRAAAYAPYPLPQCDNMRVLLLCCWARSSTVRVPIVAGILSWGPMACTWLSPVRDPPPKVQPLGRRGIVQPEYRPLREPRPCQSNSTCCFRNFWNHVLLCPV